MQKDDMRNHIRVQVGELQSRSGKEQGDTEGTKCLFPRTLQTVDAVLIGLVEKPAKLLMTWRFADDVTALKEIEQQNGVGKLQTDLKFRAMKGTAGEIPLVKSIRIEQKKGPDRRALPEPTCCPPQRCQTDTFAHRSGGHRKLPPKRRKNALGIEL
jgi:hypothetical protein